MFLAGAGRYPSCMAGLIRPEMYILARSARRGEGPLQREARCHCRGRNRFISIWFSLNKRLATLRRSWRAGVMASALRSNVNVVPVARDDYDIPTDRVTDMARQSIRTVMYLAPACRMMNASAATGLIRATGSPLSLSPFWRH